MGQGPGPYTCGIAGKHIPQSSPGHGRAGLQELPAPPVSGGNDAARPFQQNGGPAGLGGGEAGFQGRKLGQIGKQPGEFAPMGGQPGGPAPAAEPPKGAVGLLVVLAGQAIEAIGIQNQ